MHILITGGAGFLGQRLAQQLVASPTLCSTLQKITLADIVLPAAPCNLSDSIQVISQQIDLCDSQAVRALITPDITAVYHLAAVVSGQAEANFELGMAVNTDGTRNLLEAIRQQAPGIKLIFASSLAIFGGDLPAVITDKTALTPQSSYGTQKAVAELWINDYSRKGFIDGRVLRLPTVCVRPGKPNAAASSFASGIIREPLHQQLAICPVDPSLSLWLSSPTAVTNNLIHALTIPAKRFGYSRSVNLPGLSITVKEMIAALVRVTDEATAEKIQYRPDRSISEIVASWPSQFDVTRAVELGFAGDERFEEIICAFMQEMLS